MTSKQKKSEGADGDSTSGIDVDEEFKFVPVNADAPPAKSIDEMLSEFRQKHLNEPQSK